MKKTKIPWQEIKDSDTTRWVLSGDPDVVGTISASLIAEWSSNLGEWVEPEDNTTLRVTFRNRYEEGIEWACEEIREDTRQMQACEVCGKYAHATKSVTPGYCGTVCASADIVADTKSQG